jgi:hypothetical protein
MVRFHHAFTLLLASSTATVDAFHQHNPLSVPLSSSTQSPMRQQQELQYNQVDRAGTAAATYSSPKRRSTMVRPVSASASSPSPSELGDQSSNNHLNSLTNAAVDFVAGLDQPDLDAADIDRRRRLLQNRNDQKTYRVTLPLASKSTTAVMPSSAVLQIGISLCQISPGRKIDADLRLNLNTLEVEYSKAFIDGSSSTSDSQQEMNLASIQRRIDGEFQGLVVASVEKGSAGWVAGVRPGDILKSTSATIGSQLWPKSTLEGVKSALMSRKGVSQSVQFEFQRLGEIVDNQFELTLSRPIGLQMKGTEKEEEKNEFGRSHCMYWFYILSSSLSDHSLVLQKPSMATLK